MNKIKQHQPNRDELTSVNGDGSRYAIHPSDVKGTFTSWRKISAYLLIVIYASLPWIHVNGYPAVFLDTDAMRFHFLGLTFVSQDLWLAFFLISGLGFGLFYATALAGRLWCGWACPQTIFLEHVFRRIERLIEGDALKRRKLDDAPIGGEKIVKRTLKFTLFYGIAFVIAHMGMAYFLSVPKLWSMMTSSPSEHWGSFLFVVIFSSALFFNFSFFREQLCIIICPYGRLQSALIDDHSMVIGYDEKRGEPRGKVSSVDAGDCINCNRCVQVCPTGIDIRQGLQLECIGCAACIDACDTVMDKLKRPRGLVRYDSMEGLNGRRTNIVRPRIVMYTILLLIGAIVLTLSIRSLSEATMTTWRVQGPPYHMDGEFVRNQFMVRVTNKKNEGSFYNLDVSADHPDAIVKGVGDAFFVEDNGEAVKMIIVLMPRAAYTGRFDMEIVTVTEKDEVLASRTASFVGPDVKTIRSNGN
ncbi:cytochrome c oxidase accessory protein CcoG [Puniceicoccaceae bacterium K14]|nr:cytochrome c oxidase accessory protein CcoG [Puniceicoccaceae bacterium K14]